MYRELNDLSRFELGKIERISIRFINFSCIIDARSPIYSADSRKGVPGVRPPKIFKD